MQENTGNDQGYRRKWNSLKPSFFYSRKEMNAKTFFAWYKITWNNFFAWCSLTKVNKLRYGYPATFQNQQCTLERLKLELWIIRRTLILNLNGFVSISNNKPVNAPFTLKYYGNYSTCEVASMLIRYVAHEILLSGNFASFDINFLSWEAMKI